MGSSDTLHFRRRPPASKLCSRCISSAKNLAIECGIGAVALPGCRAFLAHSLYSRNGTFFPLVLLTSTCQPSGSQQVVLAGHPLHYNIGVFFCQEITFFGDGLGCGSTFW